MCLRFSSLFSCAIQKKALLADSFFRLFGTCNHQFVQPVPVASPGSVAARQTFNFCDFIYLLPAIAILFAAYLKISQNRFCNGHPWYLGFGNRARGNLEIFFCSSGKSVDLTGTERLLCAFFFQAEEVLCRTGLLPLLVNLLAPSLRGTFQYDPPPAHNPAGNLAWQFFSIPK